MWHNIRTIMRRAARLFEDSFNGEYELVLGGPPAACAETQKKGPNELEKIE